MRRPCGLNESGRQRITEEGPLYPLHGLAHRSQLQEVTDDHFGPGGPQCGAALILFPHHRTDLVTARKELVHELSPTLPCPSAAAVTNTFPISSPRYLVA
jgi:hypothetical protein